MVPTSTVGGRTRSGFPRPRGDGPMLSALKQVFGRVSRPRGDGPGSGCQASRMCRVSPPARGWSVRAEHDRPDRRGFPARSGMVPDLHRTTRFQSRFPRPRGDGPISRMPVSAKIRVSPPARHLPDEGKFAINCKSDSSGGPSSFTTPWRRGKADPNRAAKNSGLSRCRRPSNVNRRDPTRRGH